MLDRLFAEHPRAIGETYFEHFVVAASFGGALIPAGCACLVHAIVPGLCKTNASRAVERLHERMVRSRRPTEEPGAMTGVTG